MTRSLNKNRFSNKKKRTAAARDCLDQGSAAYGPRAGSGPPNKIIRPAALLQILVMIRPA